MLRECADFHEYLLQLRVTTASSFGLRMLLEISAKGTPWSLFQSGSTLNPRTLRSLLRTQLTPCGSP